MGGSSNAITVRLRWPASMVATRWQKAGLCTLLCVVRSRERLGIVSKEVSYYVSNHRPVNQAQADELFDAIRGHWGVEVMHHKRDVSLSEDDLRTGKAEVSRLARQPSHTGYQLIRRYECQEYGGSD